MQDATVYHGLWLSTERDEASHPNQIAMTVRSFTFSKTHILSSPLHPPIFKQSHSIAILKSNPINIPQPLPPSPNQPLPSINDFPLNAQTPTWRKSAIGNLLPSSCSTYTNFQSVVESVQLACACVWGRGKGLCDGSVGWDGNGNGIGVTRINQSINQSINQQVA